MQRVKFHSPSGLWQIRIIAKDSLNNHFLAGVTTCVVDGSPK